MPDSSPKLPPVGIDLGTTYSVVATLDAQGRPVTIQNSEGDATTPSVVMFDPAALVIGKEAVKIASYEPDAVAMFAKRDIGTDSYRRRIRGANVPPEVVEAIVLQKLRQDAELKLGEIGPVVITVPAYFNEPRRKATQDAGRLAGLEVLDIINEPTAAAIAYGVQQGFLSSEGAAKECETVLVYDLGGGTFDVSIMKIEGANHTTLATSGDVYLGGIDWDQRIVNFIADAFAEQHGGVDPREDDAAKIRLGREAEDAKRALTARPEVTITFEHAGNLLRTTLTRDGFEELTLDLVERTRFTMRKVLQDAKLQWSDVTRVLLVGGSTRMPMIHKMIEDETGNPADRSLAADEAVAHGAAIYAGHLLSVNSGSTKADGVESIVNVNSHDLGVLATEKSTGRPRRRILIARNSPLPSKSRSKFMTHKENQSSVQITVVEGGDDSGLNATKIGKLVVSDLPKGLPAGTNVIVTFAYEENGRLVVHASLPDVDIENSAEIERVSGMSDAEMEKWTELFRSGNILEGIAAEAEAEIEEIDEFAEILIDDSSEEATAVDDDAFAVEDDEALPMVFDEAEEESLEILETTETVQAVEPTETAEPIDEISFDGIDDSPDNNVLAEDSDLNSFLKGFEP